MPSRDPGAGAVSARVSAERFRDLAARRGLIAGAIALVVLFAVGAAVTEAAKLDFGELHVSGAWLAAAFAGFAALQLVHAVLWRRQMHALGVDLPPRFALATWCTSALARYVPTSMLMPTLRTAMCASRGVQKRIVVASLVYEAALAVVGALIVAAYFVIQLPALAGTPSRWLVIVIPLAALVAIHPRVFRPLTARALVRLRREPLELTLSERQLLGFSALYALSFLLAGASLWALCEGLYDVRPGDLPTVLGAFAVGFAVSVMAFVLPAGLGAREVALAAALAPALEPGAAAAVAVASRLVQLAIEGVLAVVTPALERAQRAPAQSVRTNSS